MNEDNPGRVNLSEGTRARGREKIARLGAEMMEKNERLSFPGLVPESYAKLKESDERYPGYVTPIDELLKRFQNEGMKVVISDTESGNVHILPFESNDSRNDSILVKDLVRDHLNPDLRKLIALCVENS